MAKFGIDISKWEKGFDFDKALEEGVEFVILRGAYTIYKDTCFDAFYKACRARKIPMGVYLYSMAKSVAEAKEEAESLISNVLKGNRFEYPIYFDLEDQTQKSLGKDLLTDIIITFCETLENAGYYVGIYSTAAFLKSYTHEEKLASYDKWIAQWASRCTYKGDYGMWQFGGETNKIRSNKVAGMVCDQNYAYVDYPSIIKGAKLNGFGSDPKESYHIVVGDYTDKAEAEKMLNTLKGHGIDGTMIYSAIEEDDIVAPNLKSIEEVAWEVIRGKWGSGNARVNALEDAGYNHIAVQKRVNEILLKKN